MEAEHQHVDGFDIIRIKGEIDLHHSPKLRSVLQERATAKAEKLIIDFQEVTYIDSSGLATFVEYYQSARKYDGKVALTSLSQRVRSVFELVRLSEVFPIYGNEHEARQALDS